MLPVPILHLGIVRLAWSSHLTQGCYMINQLAAWRFKPPTCIFRIPYTIHLATTPPHKLNKHILWNIIEIDWKEANMTLKRNKIKLPTPIIILLRDKLKCNMDILKNRIDIFSVETSFHQFSNMASSGLRKMFILQYYIHKNVYQKMFFKITFFFFIMADVMPYVRLMLCLG